jgi:hypothetical protein
MSILGRISSFFRPEPQMSQSEKDQAALSKTPPECPDCGSTHLISGPRGGAAQNVACATCLSEFNVIAFHMIIIDRMGKLTPERALSVYGIEVAHA